MLALAGHILIEIFNVNTIRAALVCNIDISIRATKDPEKREELGPELINSKHWD
jgi:hypothetical protein